MKRLMILTYTGLFALPTISASRDAFALQSPQETQSCSAKQDWILHVRKPDAGWDIQSIDVVHKIRREIPALSSAPGFEGVNVAEYAIRRKYFVWTEVVINPCDHSASLKTQHLRLDHVYGYSKNRNIFAYVLSGNCGSLERGVWIAAGCDTSIALTDTSGKKKFDLLEIGKSTPSSVPDWVNK